MSSSDDARVVIVGAGPAGLAAAWELSGRGLNPVVIDRHDRPGGLARTEWRAGYGFDVGPHRFFTKSAEVESLWKEVLGEDLLEVDRLTRIYFKGRLFSYPLKPFDAFRKLGPITTLRALVSYAAARLRRTRSEPRNFEDWISAQFGRVLYEMFFKTYTEKVWGIPCDEIGKEWAGQRIRGLSLGQAIKHGFSYRRGAADVRSLVERFYYPRRGAGQLYEVMSETLTERGTELRFGSSVDSYVAEGNRIAAVTGSSGQRTEVDHVFVSAPITDVVQSLDPKPPDEVIVASNTLYYRSHITVNLVTEGASPFPDNWIYIHAPELRMARIANYGSFSDAMVGRPGTSALAVEYFCFVTDDLWAMSDEELIALAARELEAAHLVAAAAVRDGFVVREADSYPTYYLGHQEHFDVLYDYLSRFENMTLVGRAGMYRYNNQDHATLTGLYAARNFLGETHQDLFAINAEEEYLEEHKS